MTLSFCRDGDVKLSSHLDSHPLVSEQCEDLSHFTKRMYKQCTTVFGQSEPVKHLVEELQKFARSLIAWFSENSKAFSDPNRAARHYFLQAPPLHFLGCHSLCPSFSVCRAASYAVSREVRFFADQPDEAKKSQVVNSLRSILITCWPEDAKVVTAQRSSLVEALHNEAARAHNKSTYFAKTWGARDDQAMGQHNQGLVGMANTVMTKAGVGHLNPLSQQKVQEFDNKSAYHRKHARENREKAINQKRKRQEDERERRKLDEQAGVPLHTPGESGCAVASVQAVTPCPHCAKLCKGDRGVRIHLRTCKKKL